MVTLPPESFAEVAPPVPKTKIQGASGSKAPLRFQVLGFRVDPQSM